MNASNSMVTIRDLQVRFGNVIAVDGVSLDIHEGEFFSILGPSGCGKTTLLRAIAGLDFPQAGTVTIDSIDMTDVPPHRRPVNMVFQSYALFPHLDVLSNVTFGLLDSDFSKAERQQRAVQALENVDLSGLERRNVSQLSGGQRQRVALARALVCEPRVLLLDEPLAALDKKLRGQMQIELREIQRRVGITFIQVTHDQEEAMVMSDRIAVMFDGQLDQVDEPSRLYHRPATRSVASFIGEINMIDARVVDREGSTVVLDAPPLGRVRACAADNGFSVGDAATLAFRPEHVLLSDVTGSHRQDTTTGTVQQVAFLGRTQTVHIDLGMNEVTPISAAVFADELLLNEGQRVELSLRSGSAIALPYSADEAD